LSEHKKKKRKKSTERRKKKRNTVRESGTERGFLNGDEGRVDGSNVVLPAFQ
jgi:hypothetical protein